MLRLWQHYRTLYSQCGIAVQKQEERADRLLKSATDKEISEEESCTWMKDCDVSRDDIVPTNLFLLNIQYSSVYFSTTRRLVLFNTAVGVLIIFYAAYSRLIS